MLGGTINTDFDPAEVDTLVDKNIEANKKVEVIKDEVVEKKEEIKTDPVLEKKEDVVDKGAAPDEKKIEVKEKEVVSSVVKKEEIATPDPVKDLFTELKERFGVETREELDAILGAKAAKKDETPEEKIKREKTYAANLDKYLQDENIMSREKIIEYEAVKGKSDKDLAIESFTKEFKAENADADDEDIADAIESRFHLKTENAKLKKVGEAIIKKDAAAIKGSFESTYTNGKAQFDKDQKALSQIPQFNQSVDNYAKTLPSTIEAFKKDDLVVNFDLTPEIRKQISDTVLKSHEVFNQFLKTGDTPEFKELLRSRTREAIISLNHASMINVVAEANFSKGLKSGSTVGAKQPFAVVQEKGKTQATKASKEQAKANVLKDNEESLARY